MDLEIKIAATVFMVGLIFTCTFLILTENDAEYENTITGLALSIIICVVILFFSLLTWIWS